MDNNNRSNNNQRNRGFFHPRFIQDLFRPRFNARDEDEDIDMPALEPIESNNVASSMAVSPSSHDAEGASQPSASTGVSRPTHNDDSDSMPDLQSISDSSESGSEDDADEVEMMPDLQPVDDDNDSSWTDDEATNHGDLDDDEDMPPLEPVGTRPQASRSSNRRARVDEDDDGDRDRRHPSQRTSNDEPNNINTNNQLPHPQPPPVPPPQHQHQHPVINIPGIIHIVSRGPLLGTNPDGTADTFQLFQRLFGGAMREFNPNVPRPQQPGDPPVNANGAPTFAGGFTITLGTGFLPGAPHQQNHAHDHGQPPMFANMPGARTPGAPGPDPGTRPEEMVDVAMFAELVARFGVGLGQALGIASDEQEDPERAKRLVNGLEEVPVGLVRRLERVGGAPGGHIDASVVAGGSENTSDVPGCAICWDRLLDAEGDGFATKEVGETEKEEVAEVDGNTIGQPQTEPLPNTLPTSATTQPKIVSLPCAHVFHASCLLPWFSRPRQTTCPTCRFNVDPENLTFVRRPNRPRPDPSSVPPDIGADTGTGAAGAGTGVNVNAGEGEVNVGAQPNQGMHVHIVELGLDGGPLAPTAQPIFPAPAAQPAPPTPTPAPNANANVPPPNANPNGGFWTFGIDMIFENEDGDDVDMEGAGPDERHTEDLAHEFMGRMGGLSGTPAPAPNPGPNPAGVAPTPAPDHPQTGIDDAGAGPGARFAQIFNMGNGAFVAGNAGPGGESQPQSLGDFMQMFEGAMGGAGAGANRPADAVPAQAAGGNIPTGDAQAAFAQLFGGLPTAAGGPRGPHIHTHGPAPPPLGRRQKKPWSPPAAPGPTLRQRVEQKEREVGLRCFDMSCGIGPSDEEPFATMSDCGTKQLSVRPSRNNLSAGMGTSMCTHTFHPSCLVSAVRVSLRGTDEVVVSDEVEVSCPNCRVVGCISKVEWEEGVQALV